MKFKKVYVDTKFMTPDSKSTSDFSIDIISHIFILHYMSIKMMLILLTALVSASAFLYVDGASSLLRD